MTSTEGKVVVDVTLSTRYSEELGKWIVRMKNFGITAYGRDEDEATTIAMDMFSEEIQVHRNLGNLERWLNTLPVKWYWEKNYTKQAGREYKDVSVSEHRSPVVKSKPRRMANTTPVGDLALAA